MSSCFVWGVCGSGGLEEGFCELQAGSNTVNKVNMQNNVLGMADIVVLTNFKLFFFYFSFLFFQVLGQLGLAEQV